jgi:predicted amidophosphoribosyltransferase
VLALKVRRRTAVAGLLAAAMVTNAPADFFRGPFVIVPVPAHPARRRARGIDHARLIASAVASRAGAPCAPRALVRAGASARQVGAGRQSRLAASAGPAGVSPGRTAADVVGARVVLVDDVHTTGATLDACARVLLSTGAHDVAAVTAVRALG